MGTQRAFLYFVDHGDPGVREATRRGREAEFRDFFEAAGGVPPDPTSTTCHRRSVLDHHEKARPAGARRLELHRALIRLRKAHPALSGTRKGSMQVVLFRDKNVLAVRRWAGKREVSR